MSAIALALIKVARAKSWRVNAPGNRIVQRGLGAAVLFALSGGPKGEVFRSIEPGGENNASASRGKFQDIAIRAFKGFCHEKVSRSVQGQTAGLR